MLITPTTMDTPEPDNVLAGHDPKPARLLPPSPSSSPSPKRRRSMQKRVVSIPIQEADASRAKGAGECVPPSDTWAWRKYGQKPIKGSPYPRGYYRCSSSKGCPARKQVERSRVDPTTLLVTYTCDHNHPWPVPPKSSNNQSMSSNSVSKTQPAPFKGEMLPDPAASRSPPEPAVVDPDEPVFPDLMMMPDMDFWCSDVGSTSSASPSSDTWLYGPIVVGSAELADDGKFGDFKDDDEDALFAGLGELPEYSTVFRRSYLERQLSVHTAVLQ